MSGTGTPDDDTNGDEFDLAEFVNRKSSLFAVMGVFVAVAAFLSRAESESIMDGEMMLKAGYTASLGLAFLMFLLIYR